MGQQTLFDLPPPQFGSQWYRPRHKAKGPVISVVRGYGERDTKARDMVESCGLFAWGSIFPKTEEMPVELLDELPPKFAGYGVIAEQEVLEFLLHVPMYYRRTLGGRAAINKEMVLAHLEESGFVFPSREME